MITFRPDTRTLIIVDLDSGVAYAYHTNSAGTPTGLLVEVPTSD